MKTNSEILKEIHIIKHHKPNTIKNYKKAVAQYCGFHQKNLDELITEAENEEDMNIKWKRRTLKNRLITYRQYLIENYSKKSINTYFSPIINIYRYYEIEIHDLPGIDKKSLNSTPPITYKDLPDKEVIRAALEIASPVMVAIILFMCSSGCAKAETLSLTINDYMEATKEYHNTTTINEMIDKLNQTPNVIPTFNILRIKTNKYYTTYCTPEAVTAINNHLLSRTDPLTPESKLFKIGETNFTLSFEEINDTLGLGRTGKDEKGYRRFRSHLLRKFHASALYNDGMSIDNVNDLQGKSKNRTDSVYFMINPEDLKLEYIEHMNAVIMGKEVEKISIKSQEFLELQKKLEEKEQELEETIETQQSKYEKLKNRIEALERKDDDEILDKFRKKH